MSLGSIFVGRPSKFIWWPWSFIGICTEMTKNSNGEGEGKPTHQMSQSLPSICNRIWRNHNRNLQLLEIYGQCFASRKPTFFLYNGHWSTSPLIITCRIDCPFIYILISPCFHILSYALQNAQWWINSALIYVFRVRVFYLGSGWGWMERGEWERGLSYCTLRILFIYFWGCNILPLGNSTFYFNRITLTEMPTIRFY